MSGTWFVLDSLVIFNMMMAGKCLTLILILNSMVLASSAMASGSPGTDSFNDVFSNVAALRIISQGSAFSATAQDHYGRIYRFNCTRSRTSNYRFDCFEYSYSNYDQRHTRSKYIRKFRKLQYHLQLLEIVLIKRLPSSNS